MLRTPLLVALALAIAFAGGIYSTIAAIEADDAFDVLAIGPWEATPLAQTDAANPYAKARRARTGSFALGQAEGLLFRTAADSTGARLRGTCSYRIAGQTPPSRLWVMRLTTTAGATLDSPDIFPQTVHSNDLLRAPDGTFAVRLDGQARSGNWIRLAHDGPFEIEITLYDTPAAGNFGLIDLAMPSVERLDCDDA
ncbi:DUF1214 domain-containing protein [Pararhizobium haloflavum]|uniref:DUF1214 domain-containing protein n=1 Tax=Pararhizobium haloflavum TaxID=2037914 RepID=UPI000C180B92|nr:DUF1214 domain-containing protein [Pararhizobium haloflavum]